MNSWIWWNITSNISTICRIYINMVDCQNIWIWWINNTFIWRSTEAVLYEDHASTEVISTSSSISPQVIIIKKEEIEKGVNGGISSSISSQVNIIKKVKRKKEKRWWMCLLCQAPTNEISFAPITPKPLLDIVFVFFCMQYRNGLQL